MECLPVNASEYNVLFSEPCIAYQSVAFNELNAGKVDRLHFLHLKEAKSIAGIIVGESNGVWRSPFSAPFGGITFINAEVRIEVIESALDCLLNYAFSKGMRFEITLPPLFYDKAFYSRLVFSLLRFSAPTYADINYAFDLQGTADYTSVLQREGRRNLKKAKTFTYVFEVATSQEKKQIAYDLIKQNKESKGYPLKMSFSDLESTMQNIPGQYFVLHMEGKPVAGAVVLQVTPKIAQMIYWGDPPGLSAYRPVNLLACELFHFYKQAGFAYLDIGPSSQEGIANIGLCHFKETIGSFADLKYHFSIQGSE